MRPSDEKFMDNTNFKIGKFRPIKSFEWGDGEGGGYWLGNEFLKSINYKPFSV